MSPWQILKRYTPKVGISSQGQNLYLLALRRSLGGGFQVREFKKISSAEYSSIRPISCITAIHYGDIISKTLQLDARLTQKEIKQVVLEQAKQSLGDILATLILDFELDSLKPNDPLITVRWSAAKRKDIENIVADLQGYNLAVSVIDVDAFALHRLAYFLSQQMHLNNYATAIIHSYPDCALICVIKHNRCLLMQRESKYNDLLASLAKFQIKHIWLSGEHSSKSICEEIYLSTQIETTLANPFAFMNLHALKNWEDLAENSHDYSLACALAMRK